MEKKKISDRIADQLQTIIAESGLKAGEKLPSERMLADRLDVSRPSVREAIRKLSSKGIIESKQGGGTYVVQSAHSVITDPLLDLMQEKSEFRFDILEVRHALDGLAAYFAALRATEQDRQIIREKYDAMIRLHSTRDNPVEAAAADAAFHLAVTEASHNLALLTITRSLFKVLQHSIKNNLDKLYTIPRISERLTDQHQKLMVAVLDGDPAEARLAAHEHLVYVEESLQEIDKEQARLDRFLRRASILTTEK
jgi:DNA-binding FadR family transcriptional regulator